MGRKYKLFHIASGKTMAVILAVSMLLTGPMGLLEAFATDTSFAQDSGEFPVLQHAPAPLTASVTATVTATVGYQTVNVNLSGGTSFADQSVVELLDNWLLEETGTSDVAIASISRQSNTTARLTLQNTLTPGSYTLTADACVFAPEASETQVFNVTLHIPFPAIGTATANAGERNIAVNLTSGGFANSSSTSNWTLGGTSSGANSITAVANQDGSNVTVTLANDIRASDKYTLQAAQGAFANVMTMPFAAPLTVTINAGDTTPPAFEDGSPSAGVSSMVGRRQVGLSIRAQEPAYHDFVVVQNGANAPSKEQVRAGKDADGKDALYVSHYNSLSGAISTSAFTPLHDIDYDVYVILRDDAGNLSEPVKVDVKSPPAADFIVASYPQVGETQPNGSKQVQIKVQVQNTDRQGKVYWVLLPDGASAPSIDEVGAGKASGGGAPVSGGSPEAANNALSTFLVTGAADATAYDLYLVVGDTINANPLAECTEVCKLDVTTPAAGTNAFEVNGASYSSLSSALGAVANNSTIKLLRTVNTVENVVIDNKTITFDLNGFDLNINSPQSEGIKVTEGTLNVTGSGKLNVTGKHYGVWANKGTVTVDDAQSSDGIGVYAIINSHITVRGNAVGQSNGVYAENIYTTVTVKGDVTSTTGQIQGAVYALSQAQVIVEGNVSTTSGYGVHTNHSGIITVESDVYGLRAGAITEGTGGVITVKGNLSSHNHCAVITSGSSGNITVEGEITPSGNANYALINNVAILKLAGVPDPAKPGYLKYSGAGATGVVWAKQPFANVCTIGTTGYATLDEALSAVTNGQTIRLLTDIAYEKSVDYNGAIKISGKRLTIDLNGHDLSIFNSGLGSGLELRAGANVDVIGTGNLKLKAKFAALNVSQGTFISDDTASVTLESILNTGIDAYSARITIGRGAMTGVYGGINTTGDSIITFQGPITVNGSSDATCHGVNLSGTDNIVHVGGNIRITGGGGAGISIENGGTVTVGSSQAPASVTSSNSAGIWTRQGSSLATVAVYGDVTGRARGVDATGDAKITVVGNVKSNTSIESLYAVEGFANSDDDITIDITGNVEGPGGVKVHGNSSSATITGNVTATSTDTGIAGVYASYGSVMVTGNVVASKCIGAEAGENGQVTINGVLTGQTYAKVYYVAKAVEDKTIPTTRRGYHTYKNQNAVVWVKDGAPATTYLLTVQNGTGGGSYLSGTPVSITANAPAQGKVFEKWTTSGGGSFANATSAGTTFTMPSGAVTVTAVYQDVPAGTYALTINGSYAGTSGAGQYTSGVQVAIHAGSKTGYRFEGWTSAGGGSFANAGSASTTFTMPANAVTVTANWSYTGGGSNNGGGGGGGSAPTPVKPTEPVSGTTELTASADATGTITVSLTTQNLDAAIRAAKDAAAKRGVNPGDITVVFRVTAGSKDTAGLRVNLPKALQDAIIRQSIANTVVVVDQPSIQVRMDLATIREIRQQAASDVNLTAARISTQSLSTAARSAIGTRPVFDLKVNCGNGKQVESFGKGLVAVTIPYPLGANEKAGNLCAVYVDRAGKVQWLSSSAYDREAKVLRFSTNHFSVYGIGYKTDAPEFTDTNNHWSKDDIAFVAARGLLIGASTTDFSPNTGMTRGMFVTALGRLAGIDSKKYKSTKFADVPTTAYYAPYVVWAAEMGITSGTSATTFSPDKTITRQELAMLMQNYAKAMKYTLPVTREAIAFADNSSIAGWAVEAVKSMQRAGIVNGKDGNRFDPTGTATRAEASAVLRRYVELVIDAQTAQGLDVNDSGSTMLYENGKSVKGTTRIVGGSTYTFNGYGEAALQAKK